VYSSQFQRPILRPHRLVYFQGTIRDPARILITSSTKEVLAEFIKLSYEYEQHTAEGSSADEQLASGACLPILHFRKMHSADAVDLFWVNRMEDSS
jgi:hypothetical protein